MARHVMMPSLAPRLSIPTLAMKDSNEDIHLYLEKNSVTLGSTRSYPDLSGILPLTISFDMVSTLLTSSTFPNLRTRSHLHC